MKRKSAIIVAILIMSIGFAAISTTLIINGAAKVGENPDDFSVIFTSASLDGTDVYANIISQDKKTITFETKELKTLNDSSILSYEVTNNSSNYDVEVQVNCKVKDNKEAKYTSIKNELENNATKVLAKETLNGTLTIIINKTATEEVREEYVCTLTFNAVERNELGSYTGPTEWTFDYTGGEQTFVAPLTGTYKLETWGAQGSSSYSGAGGYGGYSVGNINLDASTKLFINAGGKGGYNGGNYISGGGPAGGGATHISTVTGLLSNLENYKSNIIIVSGGGGAGERQNGGSGGGYIGVTGYALSNSYLYFGTGGTQSSGGSGVLSGNYINNLYDINGSFGSGGIGYEKSDSGPNGGGGYYGGGATTLAGGAGGGSGYIGNASLTEKVMYCYNCEESTEESTKTISTTCTNATPTENCAKSGNGYARITLIK